MCSVSNGFHCFPNRRVSLDILSTQKPKSIPWAEREPKAFFRGRDSNKARLDLVRLYRNWTDLFDVAITAFFFFKHDEDLYGPKLDRVGFYDFFKVRENESNWTDDKQAVFHLK